MTTHQTDRKSMIRKHPWATAYLALCGATAGFITLTMSQDPKNDAFRSHKWYQTDFVNPAKGIWQFYSTEDIKRTGDLWDVYQTEVSKRNDIKGGRTPDGKIWLPDLDGDGLVGEAEFNDSDSK